MAGGNGFEPLLAESESAVLPLDEPPSSGISTYKIPLCCCRDGAC